MTFRSINPATGQLIAEYASHSASDVQELLSKADHAQQRWQNVGLAERTLVIRRISERLELRLEEAAKMITSEMGKPLSQARAEVMKCRTVCDYMATAAITALREEHISTSFASAVVHHQPLGLVFCIMPWNFPLWQFFRFAIPALAAGNGVIVKHAPNTIGSALLAVEICHQAGIPSELLQCVLVDVPDVEGIIEDDRIQAVSFTGSTSGGRAVGALAGRSIKKSVLELGGSDAYLVMDDANIEAAAEACVQQRCANTGQSCIAAKRFLVHASIADAFQELVVGKLMRLRVGNPTDPDMDLGPMARADLKATLLDQVGRAIGQGARLIVQGNEGTVDELDVPGPGYYVHPGLLIDVVAGSVADQEELFGPVAAMIVVHSEEEAIGIANGSGYGLGAAVFSADISRAHRIAAQLQVGTVFINGFVRSDARIPFGGVKSSGYGRELGLYGLHEFVNIKSIVEP